MAEQDLQMMVSISRNGQEPRILTAPWGSEVAIRYSDGLDEWLVRIECVASAALFVDQLQLAPPPQPAPKPSETPTMQMPVASQKPKV
jgi:hypothetical protein